MDPVTKFEPMKEVECPKCKRKTTALVIFNYGECLECKIWDKIPTVIWTSEIKHFYVHPFDDD